MQPLTFVYLFITQTNMETLTNFFYLFITQTNATINIFLSTYSSHKLMQQLTFVYLFITQTNTTINKFFYLFITQINTITNKISTCSSYKLMQPLINFCL